MNSLKEKRNKKKDKNLELSDEVHKELGQIGRLTEDYGDVVERLIKFYREPDEDKS
jgi:hypothetical protein